MDVGIKRSACSVSLAGAATSIIFVATMTCLSQQNTSFVMTKVCLSRQNFSRAKHIFVETKHLSRQCLTKGFVATSLLLSRQTHVSRYKKKVFCRDKSMLVFVSSNIYRDKSFATTKRLSCQAYICRDKRRVLSQPTRVGFVATKFILVAVPANDSSGTVGPCLHSSCCQNVMGDQYLHLVSESTPWRVSVCTRSGLGQPLVWLFNNLDGGMG